MTTTRGQILYSGQLVATSPTTIYTVPGNSAVTLSTMSVCNMSGFPTSVVDGATTLGSTTVTSVTANWTILDIGKEIAGAGVPAAATIASVTNTHTIHLSAPAEASGGPVTLTWDVPSGAATLTVSLLKAGQTDDASHMILYVDSIDAGATLSLASYVGGASLAAGDALSLTTDTGQVLDVVLTGAVTSLY